MDDVDALFVDRLAGKSSAQVEKIESFEVSTVAAILRQMGATSRAIDRLKETYGVHFGPSWFNQDFEYDDNTELVVHREFRFNFGELFTKPQASPIVEAFSKVLHSVEYPTMIFKAHEVGRLVLTVRPPPDTTTALRIAGKHFHRGMPAWLLPFAGYYASYQITDEDLQ